MSSAPNLFLGLRLPEAAQAQASALLRQLETSAGQPKVVRRDGLHLTVAFLGAVPPAQLPAVEAAAEAGSREQEPFPVTLGGLGGFPSLARPRVLFLGLREGADELGRLAISVRRRLQAAGIPFDARPFSPHCTLARTPLGRRDPRGGEGGLDRLTEAGRELSFLATELSLMESGPAIGGPARYLTRRRWPLSLRAG